MPLSRFVLARLLVVFVALSTWTAQAAEPPADPPQQEQTDWVDTVNEWYPIVLDDNLEPEMQDNLVGIYVTSVFCGALCGPLWIPLVWTGVAPDGDYFAKEALIAIAVEWLSHLVGVATTPALGIGAVFEVVNLTYLTPVGIINTYDRALKKKRARLEAEKAERGPATTTMLTQMEPAMAF